MSIVCLMKWKGHVTLALPPTSGPIRATFIRRIGPGWRMFGRTYEEWAALPAGTYEIPADYDPDEDDYAPPELAVVSFWVAGKDATAILTGQGWRVDGRSSITGRTLDQLASPARYEQADGDPIACAAAAVAGILKGTVHFIREPDDDHAPPEFAVEE